MVLIGRGSLDAPPALLLQVVIGLAGNVNTSQVLKFGSCQELDAFTSVHRPLQSFYVGVSVLYAVTMVFSIVSC
jgi:hypothetical protein